MQSDKDRQKALLRLMTWLSPAFPIGGFSYSGGLETAITEDKIPDAEQLLLWLDQILTNGGLRNDVIFLVEAYRYQASGQDFEPLSQLALALAGSAERHAEISNLGASFVLAAAAWPDPVLHKLQGEVAYSVAVGAVAAAHGVPLADAAAAFVQAQIGQLLSVAVRLGMIGQSQSLGILSRMEDRTVDCIEQFCSLSLGDLGSATISADILSMRHEVQYSRLFQS